jgi:hypothetical protein
MKSISEFRLFDEVRVTQYVYEKPRGSADSRISCLNGECNRYSTIKLYVISSE